MKTCLSASSRQIRSAAPERRYELLGIQSEGRGLGANGLHCSNARRLTHHEASGLIGAVSGTAGWR